MFWGEDRVNEKRIRKYMQKIKSCGLPFFEHERKVDSGGKYVRKINFTERFYFEDVEKVRVKNGQIIFIVKSDVKFHDTVESTIKTLQKQHGHYVGVFNHTPRHSREDKARGLVEELRVASQPSRYEIGIDYKITAEKLTIQKNLWNTIHEALVFKQRSEQHSDKVDTGIFTFNCIIDAIEGTNVDPRFYYADTTLCNEVPDWHIKNSLEIVAEKLGVNVWNLRKISDKDAIALIPHTLFCALDLMRFTHYVYDDKKGDIKLYSVNDGRVANGIEVPVFVEFTTKDTRRSRLLEEDIDDLQEYIDKEFAPHQNFGHEFRDPIQNIGTDIDLKTVAETFMGMSEESLLTYFQEWGYISVKEIESSKSNISVQFYKNYDNSDRIEVITVNGASQVFGTDIQEDIDAHFRLIDDSSFSSNVTRRKKEEAERAYENRNRKAPDSEILT